MKANNLFLIGDLFRYLMLTKNLYQKRSRQDSSRQVLPFLIDPGQTAYANGRFLGESGRLIADIIETCDLEN